jgi:hypothetical protein
MRRLWLLVAVTAIWMVAGCAMAAAPVNGSLFLNVKGPVAATANADDAAVKEGKATCTSILGIIGTGDASIEAAMQKAGITKIRNVDHESKSILGIIASYTTIVYGW